MNPKQELFASEYVVDHNAARAAIRAGYAPARAKQTGWRLLQQTDIRQAVGKLDSDRRRALGIDADWIAERLVAVHEKAFEGAPRTDKDGAVRVEVDGQLLDVFDWSPSGAVRPLELLMRQLGIGSQVETHEVNVSGEVVYTLTLDRELPGDSGGD